MESDDTHDDAIRARRTRERTQELDRARREYEVLAIKELTEIVRRRRELRKGKTDELAHGRHGRQIIDRPGVPEDAGGVSDVTRPLHTLGAPNAQEK